MINGATGEPTLIAQERLELFDKHIGASVRLTVCCKAAEESEPRGRGSSETLLRMNAGPHRAASAERSPAAYRIRDGRDSHMTRVGEIGLQNEGKRVVGGLAK